VGPRSTQRRLRKSDWGELATPNTLLGEAMPTHPLQNQLIASLSDNSRAAVMASCEIVANASGEILHHPMQAIQFVDFPIDCVLSVIKEAENGSIVEVMTVGREGLSSLLPFFGARMSPMRCLSQVSGTAVRMPLGVIESLTPGGAELSQMIGRYAQGAFNQIAQSAMCNLLHTIEQRCARWLLMTHDRAGRNEIRLTHQFLAFMLGVRRAGVTEVELKFRKNGLIDYRRGNVSIIDRVGLERIACECYGSVTREYERLLTVS
jgi:hypothetical protein